MSNGYPDWISCEERLPDRSGYYLVTSEEPVTPFHLNDPCTGLAIMVQAYSAKTGWIADEKVYAWMPLPEIYPVQGYIPDHADDPEDFEEEEDDEDE